MMERIGATPGDPILVSIPPQQAQLAIHTRVGLFVRQEIQLQSGQAKNAIGPIDLSDLLIQFGAPIADRKFQRPQQQL